MVKKGLLLCLILLSGLVSGQNFLDKDFYLIDSLEETSLNDSDKLLLDSCLTIYHKGKTDRQKLNQLSFITENLLSDRWIDYQDLTFELCQKELKIHTSGDYYNDLKDIETGYYHNYGLYYKTRGKYAKSLRSFKKSIQISREMNFSNHEAHSTIEIGSLFYDLGNISEAINRYEKALSIHKKDNNEEGIGASYNNLGFVYKYLGEKEEALKLYKKGLTHNLKGDVRGVAISYNNIGLLFLDLNQPDSAKYYLEKSLEIELGIDDPYEIATAYNNLGEFYFTLGDYNKARDLSNKALGLYEEVENDEGIALSYHSLGKIFFEEGVYNQALELLTKAKNINERIGLPSEISANSEILYKIHKLKGNEKLALENHEDFILMRDSVQNEKNTKAAISSQYRHEYTLKSFEDSLIRVEEDKVIQAERESLQIKAKADFKQKIYLSIGFVLIAIFGVFMFNRFKVAKRQKLQIEDQKKSVEEQKAQIEHQHIELEETHKEISDSIIYAERLQKAVLPAMEDVRDAFKDSFIFFRPKDVVSGDFYWFEEKNHIKFLASADCTGHGVPGAMVSVVCSNALFRSVNEFDLTSPAEILNKTRELVISTFAKSGQEVKDGMDIALCTINGGKISYAGANNPIWIIRENKFLTEEDRNNKYNLIGEERSLIEIKADKQPVGLFTKQVPFTDNQIRTYENDRFFLFTDGFADQFGGKKGKKFKYKPFKRLLLNSVNMDVKNQMELLNSSFEEWKGSYEQVDDICVIGFEV